MPIRAKLYVAEVKRQAGSPDAVQVVLGAVTRGDENKTWAEAAPAAQFTMTIQNPDAAVQFRLGQEFYVDFTAVGEPATLTDGHEYQPSSYETEQMAKFGDSPSVERVAQFRRDYSHHRCQACGCKWSSHEEPTRSKLAEWRP